jgi:DNA-binding response OmpR family regulator
VAAPVQGPGEQREMPYSFGAYRFDPARYELTHGGTPVPLRPKGCELLAYLLTHRDRVVCK